MLRDISNRIYPNTHVDGDSCLGTVYFRRMDKKMPIKNKCVIYNYGLVDLEKFPRGKLIKSEGNKEFYEVPEDIEILTVWNGDKKWVHPESYSIHKNLNMILVKTHRGNSVECSKDHTLVTVDKNLNYVRAPAKVGMCIPKVVGSIDQYIDPSNYLQKIDIDNISYRLDKDLGYLIGSIIGDGWVNFDDKLNDIMLATIHFDIRDKITSILKSYGYVSTPTTIIQEHEFDGKHCTSKKHTWVHKPTAKLLRDNIGHGAINKHLPDWWATSPILFRWGLLSGLIDTDGTICPTSQGRYAVSYSSTSKQLIYQIAALINSLGGYCSMSVQTYKDNKYLWYVICSKAFYTQLKQNLELYNPSKKSYLNELPTTSYIDIMEYTPNINPDKCKELRQQISFASDSKAYNFLREIEKRHSLTGQGGYGRRDILLNILAKYKHLIQNDPYWNKLIAILQDTSISWEVIKSITPLPITEAYDLTTPPYCTFTLHNGIVVYDTVSLNIVYTEESIKEITDLLNNSKYYITPDGSMSYSADDDIINLVLAHMTDNPSGRDLTKE